LDSLILIGWVLYSYRLTKCWNTNTEYHAQKRVIQISLLLVEQ